MEHDSLLVSPNDDHGRKQKKGSTSVVWAVSTAILLGLVFYYTGGEYYHRGSHRIGGGGGDTTTTTAAPPYASTPMAFNFLLIPVGGNCKNNRHGCVTPPGLKKGVCRRVRGPLDDVDDGNDNTVYACQSGQPGAYCDLGKPDDCVNPKGLNHPVCLPTMHGFNRCQGGLKGDFCGSDLDCSRNLCHPTTKNKCRCDRAWSPSPKSRDSELYEITCEEHTGRIDDGSKLSRFIKIQDSKFRPAAF